MENIIFYEDCRLGLRNLPDSSIDCCITSPPYFGLRDYGVSGQIGLEETPEAYIAQLVEIFTEVKRVLKPKGTLWLVIGDSYAGSGRGKGDINKKGIQQKASYVGNFIKSYKLDGYKNKDLIGIPWLLAFALRADGWYLRQDIIWHKPNPMPESVTDRCTKSHEYIFLLSKSAKYYFDYASILEPSAYDGRNDTFMKRSKKYVQGSTGLQQQNFLFKGHERWPNKIRGFAEKEGETGLLEQHHGNNIKPRLFNSKNQIGTNRNDMDNIWVDRPARNKRDVWTVCTTPEPEAHFACFPQKLIVDCIKAGCPENGTVLDPFMGSGTTAVVARKLNRKYVGFELNPKYMKIANAKLKRELGFFV